MKFQSGTRQRASENDVVTAFLDAEFQNPRHHDLYATVMARIGVGADQVESDQDVRMRLFQIARGWPDKLLFDDFPQSVQWYWGELDDEDIARLKYINYSYWNELSNNTRSPEAAALTVNGGTMVFGKSNDNFIGIAKAVRNGKQFPPLILGELEDGNYVIIEGHARATGFAIAGKVPVGQKIIVGKGAFDEWAKEGKD